MDMMLEIIIEDGEGGEEEEKDLEEMECGIIIMALNKLLIHM